MKQLICIIISIFLWNFIKGQENDVLGKNSRWKWNIFSAVGIGKFDKNLCYSASLGVGVDYRLTDKITLEFGLSPSYRSLFTNRNYKFATYVSPAHEIGYYKFAEIRIINTSIYSVTLPVIWDYQISSKCDIKLQIGILSSISLRCEQSIINEFGEFKKFNFVLFSEQPFQNSFGYIPIFDADALLGMSKDLKKLNIGFFISHNSYRLLGDKFFECCKIAYVDLRPDYIKQIIFRLKYSI